MVAQRGVANQVHELKVSGHTMALEPGLYCVFNAPDGPVPSSDTGLPGVRITAAPGQQAGSVAITGFEANGWIAPDAAALIRVSGQPAKVLVTVYQEPNGTTEAPKLQVVRLSPDPASQAQPTPTHAVLPTPPNTSEVVAHIYGKGDVRGRLNDWMGEPGSNRWIEGFALAPAGLPVQDIEYQALLGRGWLSPWAEGGQFCGSRGMSLPILGLRIKLRGSSANTHQVQLNASFVDGTRIGPLHDGDACEAPSLAALEAFHLAVVPKQPAATPATKGRNQIKASPKPPAKPEPKAAPARTRAAPQIPRRTKPAKPAPATRR